MAKMLARISGALKRRNRQLLRFYLLVVVGRLLLPQYRFKWPQLDWWQNELFDGYLRRFGELGWLNTDRRWTLYQLLRLTAGVPGDTAECGCYQGASSFLICAHNSRSELGERWHFIFDSFEGLSSPSAIDGSHWRGGDLAVAEELVKSNLTEFTQFSLHKGWIPDRFPDAADRRFAFVHIDVDLFEPTRDSIEFFYPRMSTGGIVLCDDYGCTSCPGATKAIDDYLADKPEKMIALSAGGGFLIKGCRTAPSNTTGP